MRLKHMKTVVQTQDGAARVAAMCWSPNSNKLAICTADRVILLFDEHGERKDKFSTKPSDSKYGKKSYAVRAMAFSPDSSKIAVGQTDNIIYVYKIGDEWGEKKVICNKFLQHSAVTALTWPQEGPIVCGLADGKVRIANIKSNKSSTLYASDSYVVSLSSNLSGKGIISGHADGTIIRYFFDDESSGDLQGKILTHSSPPYALTWAGGSILAGGCDKRFQVYSSRDGRLTQTFDYSRDTNEQEFTVAACSPSGQAAVVGSYDRLRVFNWLPSKQAWEEATIKEIPHFYTITTLAWTRDGSKLAAGSLCGGVELFECCLRKSIYNNTFEITYVGPSQAVITHLTTKQRTVLLSQYGYEVTDIKILGHDRYVVAHTQATLLLADTQSGNSSEVAWHTLTGNEKFYFDHENVCLIFNAGELSIVEYGCNEILGSVRTEFVNPHLISVRLNERKQRGVTNNKKLSYLVDLKTVCVVDLVTGMTLVQVSHDSKIDWLELNETGRKLLFRDKRHRLNLLDVSKQEKITLLSHCSFVQWVPGSDVVVAQNRGNLCVWYNVDTPERVTTIPVKGEVLDLERADGRTEVIVQEGILTLSYPLDEGLIEFGTAVEDGDFGRALAYLEGVEGVSTDERESMWEILGTIALNMDLFVVAEQCFAALGDVARAKYLQETDRIAQEAALQLGGDGQDNFQVRCRKAVLAKQFKLAEGILLEQNYVDEVIELYQGLHKWEDAIMLAESRGHPDLEDLQAKYLSWLMSSGQMEKAAQVREKEGDLEGAVELYLKASLPAKAASRLVQASPPGGLTMFSNEGLLNKVIQALAAGEFHEQAGQLYEKNNDPRKAMDSYRKGKAFARAVELARMSFPEAVVQLEDEWGDYLVHCRQLDAAISHYIEAGRTLKALDAAIHSQQWKKAVQIIEVIDDPSSVSPYYKKLANHYAAVSELELAEHFFVEGNLVNDAISMYNSAGLWEKAHKLASQYLQPDDVVKMYVGQAKNLENQGKYKEAEKLYISVSEPDLAISMYKKLRQYDQMIRLVKLYHPDLLVDTHLHLAKELEGEGHYSQAEVHFLAAGEWKAAINMYRQTDNWEDAYRVAKGHGGAIAAKQVAYLWAKFLGGDSAVKLLTKFGLLESAIDYAAENCAFEFAFDLAQTSMKHKLPEIHLKYAMFLEDEGKFMEAELEFIKAGKPKEAVLMYVHNQDWESAQRVAEGHDKDSVSDVLIGQARHAFEMGDYQSSESLLLRAQRADLAIKFYKDAGMWSDALRVCKEYMPSKLAQLHKEFEDESGPESNMAHKGRSGQWESLLSQAQEWEKASQHQKAVDCYLRLTSSNTTDYDILEKAWAKAMQIGLKFLGGTKAVSLAKDLGARLLAIKRHSAAAQHFLSVDLTKEAVDAFLDGHDWSRAKKVARELAPELEEHVDERYKEHLRSQGQTEQLASVDLIAALDSYAEQRMWKKCLDMAEKEGSSVLHKYVALCASQLIKERKSTDAAQLYVRYGAPAFPQNFNIYKRLAADILASRDTCSAAAYRTWADLRDILLQVVQGVHNSGDSEPDLEQLLLICHYCATRSACLTQLPSLERHVAKISASLLRYSDIIPVDKAFYEAGLTAKAAGLESMAFVFWNHLLDICEAIEEGSLDSLDHSDFRNTDIPYEVPIPDSLFLTDAEREEVREWVLAESMDQRLEQSLPTDERLTFEGSLISMHNGSRAYPCIITGYPVLRNKLDLKLPDKVANKEDWNKFLMAAKMSHSSECQDVLKFITHWCGTASSNQSYFFQ